LSLGLQNGLVIAVPIPTSEAALGSEIEAAIKHALQEARYLVINHIIIIITTTIIIIIPSFSLSTSLSTSS